MFDFISIIPGKKKNTSSGWTTFNAVCCHNRGHRVDQKMRGGVKIENHTQVYHCFNCGFKCSFTLGSKISYGTRQLLTWCGIDDSQIQRWNLLSLQQKDLLDFTPEFKHIKIRLDERKLPEGEILDVNNSSHKRYVEYLQKRHIDVSSYPFLITPQLPGRYRDRIIVPYTYKNKIVGHTSRFLDGRIPKYINEQQPGYVFNIDIQKPEWQVCILTEGIFDALSIDGIAIMHETISNEQARVIRKLNKKIVVVPDRDETGLKICDRALELGYSVSLPNWDSDVKDVNDSVVKYGKALTLISILNSATNSKIKIEMQRKKIAKSIGI